MKQKMAVVHLGVVGDRDDGQRLVPFCEIGYQAFRRGAFAPVNLNAAFVTCKHCKKAEVAS